MKRKVCELAGEKGLILTESLRRTWRRQSDLGQGYLPDLLEKADGKYSVPVMLNDFIY